MVSDNLLGHIKREFAARLPNNYEVMRTKSLAAAGGRFPNPVKKRIATDIPLEWVSTVPEEESILELPVWIT